MLAPDVNSQQPRNANDKKFPMARLSESATREVIPLFAQAEGYPSNIGTMTQRKVRKVTMQRHFLSFLKHSAHSKNTNLLVSLNEVWDVGDEYHDDEDPGYRIREIYEAQSCSICMNIMKYHADLD